MTECDICCEKYTKLTRKKITCPSPECNQSVCAACFKRYLVEGQDITPKCLFCNKPVSYNFIREMFSLTWVNKEYLSVRARHLMSRERTLLPASQEDVKQEIDRRERIRKANKIDEMIHDFLREISNLESEKYGLLYGRRNHERQKVVTLRRCPDSECNGFLEDDWKCGICKIKACSQCGEKKEKEHICDENTKATFESIRNTTRPCPKCATPIHKWEGCNQMYCTQCSCMFDYRTGRMETGFFHNPHYFDAIRDGTMRRRGEEEVIGECGRFPDNSFMRYTHWFNRYSKDDLHAIKNKHRERWRNLGNLIGLVNHISEITLDKYTVGTLDDECRVMRRKYLMKEINEEEWLKKLKNVEKKREKNNEIYQILELFRDVGRDVTFNIGEIYRKVHEKSIGKGQRGVASAVDTNVLVLKDTGYKVQAKEWIMEYVIEMEKMTEFCNKKFEKFEKHFNNKFPYISPEWQRWESRHL